MYNPKPSSAKALSTSIEMSGEMSLHDRSTHSRFDDNASVEVSLHERSSQRTTHSRRNPEMSQRSSHRSIHSSRRQNNSSSRELAMDDNRSVDSRHSSVRMQVQEEMSVAERSYDSRHSRVRDQVQEELSVAERSHQSRHSRHSSVYDEEMPLFDPMLAHSRPTKTNGVPAILSLPNHVSGPPSSLHYEHTEAASLPDRMPHHKRLSGTSQDITHALSMPDRISSHNNGFAGGLALNHPSSLKGNGWEPSHAIKPSKAVRDKLFPSLPEKPLSNRSLSNRSLDGRPPRPNSSKSLGFSEVSYFYGNGVIVSGGPPNEIFMDEFGNKCAQYVNRTIVINDHQASHAASKGKEDEESSGSSKKRSFFSGDSLRYRAILFFFMASTVLLLLMLVLGIGRKKPLVTNDYPTGDDIFFDDDDEYPVDDDDFATEMPEPEPRSGIILP